MNRAEFSEFLTTLSTVSEHAVIEPGSVDWPSSVDPDAWYFSPELISLYGTDIWASLDEQQQKRLSLAEAVNFFSLNIHGETYLIDEIRSRVMTGADAALSGYLQHFVAEETRHMAYFSEFCQRYAGKIYADRTLHSDDSDDEGLGVLALFARINLFEEIVDYYNRCMANDARLSPIAREINRIHHVEEMRHLSFGRHFLRHNLDQAVAQRDDAWHQRLREHLQAYLEFVWKQYYNPDVYADAGIPDAFAAWRDTRNAACTVSHRDKINRKRLSYLRKLGLLESM